MIVLYAPSDAEAERLGARLDAGPVRRTTDLDTFERLARDASCVVAVCRRRSGERGELFAVLAEHIRRRPDVPVILVADGDLGTLSKTAPLRLGGIVLRDRAESELAAAVRAARSPSYFARAAARVEAADRIPPAARRGLATALRAAEHAPIRSPTDLARRVSYAYVTLAQETAPILSRDVTLKDVLARLQLLKAAELRAAGRSWEVVGEELGVHRNTLARHAKRWPGCSLRQLAALPPQELQKRFEREVIAPLLDEDDGGRGVETGES